MATGNPNLRYLDRSRECQQRDGHKPVSMWIAESKCHAGRQKYQKMLETMSGAGIALKRRTAQRIAEAPRRINSKPASRRTKRLSEGRRRECPLGGEFAKFASQIL